MSSIKSLKKEIQEGTVPVSTLLRKAREISEKLGQEEFTTWIDNELNGYGKGVGVPDYRIVYGEVKGWNPFRGWIPVLFATTEVEQTISQRGASQAIPEFEELLKGDSDVYEMAYPADIANKILAQESLKTKVSLMIPRTELIGIVNHVRNTLHEWVLNLDEKGIGDESEYTDAEKKEAQSAQPSLLIGSIGTFQGNIGDGSNYEGKIMPPQEGFLSKFFWYVLVALAVLIVGNVLSALILHYLFKL